MLTPSELKSHLWNCAEILRGSAVDRTDWKAYILPLLFFKRICDVWDEETAEAAELFGDVDPVDFPEVHRFGVPAGCHWQDVRGTPANVGAALSHAMREIERTNPDTLYRVFGAADWGNREMLTDEILKDLVEALSKVSLGNNTVGSDVLGDAYEYLIGRFADVTKRKKAGEFYTPRSVVRMMVDILDPKEGESIYDPACGTGGMLLGAIEHVQRTFPSAVVGWQIVRSMFEYVATYAWVAAAPEARTEQWLKYDYVQRQKLDNDFREFGDAFLEDGDRQRVLDFRPDIEPMPNLVERTKRADEVWMDRLRELDHRFGGDWPEGFQSFRSLYPLIYRNGSRFTHPSSHVVDAFVTGNPPHLVIGDEAPLERDLAVLGSAVLVLGLALTVTATPALAIDLDDITAALAN